MEKLLENGYTIFLSQSNDDISAVALKRNQRGVIPKTIEPEELHIFTLLPGIIDKLNERNILQFYKDEKFYIEMGKRKTEGAYCEDEYLEISKKVSSVYFLDSLFKMEEACVKEDKNSKSLRKAYQTQSNSCRYV